MRQTGFFRKQLSLQHHSKCIKAFAGEAHHPLAFHLRHVCFSKPKLHLSKCLFCFDATYASPWLACRNCNSGVPERFPPSPDGLSRNAAIMQIAFAHSSAPSARGGLGKATLSYALQRNSTAARSGFGSYCNMGCKKKHAVRVTCCMFFHGTDRSRAFCVMSIYTIRLSVSAWLGWLLFGGLPLLGKTAAPWLSTGQHQCPASKPIHRRASQASSPAWFACVHWLYCILKLP